MENKIEIDLRINQSNDKLEYRIYTNLNVPQFKPLESNEHIELLDDYIKQSQLQINNKLHINVHSEGSHNSSEFSKREVLEKIECVIIHLNDLLEQQNTEVILNIEYTHFKFDNHQFILSNKNKNKNKIELNLTFTDNIFKNQCSFVDIYAHKIDFNNNIINSLRLNALNTENLTIENNTINKNLVVGVSKIKNFMYSRNAGISNISVISCIIDNTVISDPDPDPDIGMGTVNLETQHSNISININYSNFQSLVIRYFKPNVKLFFYNNSISKYIYLSSNLNVNIANIKLVKEVKDKKYTILPPNKIHKVNAIEFLVKTQAELNHISNNTVNSYTETYNYFIKTKPSLESIEDFKATCTVIKNQLNKNEDFLNAPTFYALEKRLERDVLNHKIKQFFNNKVLGDWLLNNTLIQNQLNNNKHFLNAPTFYALEKRLERDVLEHKIKQSFNTQALGDWLLNSINLLISSYYQSILKALFCFVFFIFIYAFIAAGIESYFFDLPNPHSNIYLVDLDLEQHKNQSEFIQKFIQNILYALPFYVAKLPENNGYKLIVILIKLIVGYIGWQFLQTARFKYRK